MLNSGNQKLKKYCRINDKKIGSFLDDVFLDHQIIKTTKKEECDLFIPRGDKEMNMLDFPDNTIISSVNNINELNKKHLLWYNLVNKWGMNTASQIIPPSFNILQKKDLRRFAVDYLYKKSSYILKNEQESARGILVSNNLRDITKHIIEKKELGYPITVIQKIIKSLLINKHVFKIRMFLLIKCDKKTGKKHFYLHSLGGMFYAPEKYSDHNMNNNNIIANGYWYNDIAQTDYIGFINDKPKNLRELLNYFDKRGINSKKMMRKVINLLVLIFKSVEDRIYTQSYKNDQFCILGFDIMIDDNHKPWIIEFNKGPSTKNYDDVNVYNSKKKVWGDIYKLIEGNNDNNFKEIYTV